MIAKLTVTVSVDLDATAVTVRPVGTLTSENVRGLLAVVHGAERTLPGFVVYLDVRHLHTGSQKALGALEESGVTAFPALQRGPNTPHACKLAGRRAA
jgi:hypothetical protein